MNILVDRTNWEDEFLSGPWNGGGGWVVDRVLHAAICYVLSWFWISSKTLHLIYMFISSLRLLSSRHYLPSGQEIVIWTINAIYTYSKEVEIFKYPLWLKSCLTFQLAWEQLCTTRLGIQICMNRRSLNQNAVSRCLAVYVQSKMSEIVSASFCYSVQ